MLISQLIVAPVLILEAWFYLLYVRRKGSARVHGYDALVIDAFSGGNVPAHLITREAFQLYDQRIEPGGVLAIHISNRYLDLKPVVARIAADLGLACRACMHKPTDEEKAAGASAGRKAIANFTRLLPIEGQL